MIVLASSNKNKIKEFKDIASHFDFNIISSEVADKIKDCEVGSTFLENAFMKAKAVYDIVGGNVIADDSGLEIEYLDGFPGIYSARYLAPITDYKIKNQSILDKLNGVENRKARFVCALVLISKDGTKYQSEGYMNGHIAYEIKGNNGFGYDPIFIPDGYEVSSAELSEEEKNSISHRADAFKKLYAKLPKNFLKWEEHK